MIENIDVSVIMGSVSDWPTMSKAAELLKDIGVCYEIRIISAHRTPDRLYKFATTAETRNIKVIIAGAGGAAHLPGMVASMTSIPVLGVPIYHEKLAGMDSLFSIVQMPKGVPVATFALGESGAVNAAIFSVSILSLNNVVIQNSLNDWKKKQTDSVPEMPDGCN